MQSSTARTELATTGSPGIAADLYALVVYVHSHYMSDLFEAVGALELTITQIKVLHHLENPASELTVKELGETVGISLPAASRAVEDLVRRGFVERREDPNDRRMKRVRVTPAGRATKRQLNAARLEGLERFTAGLTDTERDTVGAALTLLLQRPDLYACRPEGSP